MHICRIDELICKARIEIQTYTKDLWTQQGQERSGLSVWLTSSGWGRWEPLLPPPMASGASTGLGDVFSECDTQPPTEDSKYIFYDPGRLSPVTFA